MSMRVAVIDDEVTVCKHLQKILSKEGYEVECFLVGNPFLQRMDQEPFHLVFADQVSPIWMAWKSSRG